MKFKKLLSVMSLTLVFSMLVGFRQGAGTQTTTGIEKTVEKTDFATTGSTTYEAKDMSKYPAVTAADASKRL